MLQLTHNLPLHATRAVASNRQIEALASVSFGHCLSQNSFLGHCLSHNLFLATALASMHVSSVGLYNLRLQQKSRKHFVLSPENEVDVCISKAHLASRSSKGRDTRHDTSKGRDTRCDKSLRHIAATSRLVCTAAATTLLALILWLRSVARIV